MIRDAGSFRDPSGYIIYEDDEIIRVINYTYKENFDHFINSGFYKFLIKDQLIVSHKISNQKKYSDDQYLTICPEKIFPITYPYEWSFSQLKDAALLTLNIQKKAVEFNMSLKDASPYNVQFKDNSPIFIDTLSFEKISNSDYTWKPYKQFNEMFLAPLSLMSMQDARLSKLSINFIDGIPLSLLNKLLSFRNKLNPSIFLNVVIPHMISNWSKSKSKKEITISKKQHLNIIDQLISFIKNLKLLNENSEWENYNIETNIEKINYVKHKEKIVSSLLKKEELKLSWDIGSNDGHYSRIIAESRSDQVISMDIDWHCVEQNYLFNKKNDIKNVYPLLVDLSNPSPSIGWLNNERSSIFKRIGSPDLICCLAIMHHILNRNIPLDYFMEFLSSTKKYLLIEFVPIDDPKCQEIFESRDKSFYYPSKTEFENVFKRKFNIIYEKNLMGTKRILYLFEKLN